MKKLMTLLGVMAFALGAFADNISGVNFDNVKVESLGKLSSNTSDDEEMTPGTTGSTTYWYSAAGEDLDASVTAYADDKPVKTTVASGENNVNYLKIESSPYTAPLYRSITANTQDGDFVARSISDGLYIDTLVQFTVGSDSADQLDSAAKLALWVGTSEDTENAPTNIFVRAGYISESGLVPTNYVFAVPANFSPENWYRVTVKAINNIVSSDDTYVGFVVFVDGVALEPGANAISESALTLAPAISSKFSGKIFPSMIPSDSVNAQALSAVGFSGTGAVDDLAFTATAPFADAMDQVAFRLEWDTHVATLGVTIGGVPQEVDVEDLSKVFLYNVSDTVSISITYENGYTSTHGNAVEFTENVPDVITITSYAPGAAYWNGSAWVNVADIDAALEVVGENGGTIKLLAAETQLSDAGVTIDPGVGNVVVFDLAGKTLLGAEDGPIFLVDSGTLVITNSTPEVGEILAYDRDFANDGSIVVASGAALKVYGGLIDGIIYGDDLGDGFADGVLQIFGGKFYDSTMTSAEDVFAYAPYVAEGKYATPAQDKGVWYVTVAEGEPTPETFIIRIVKSDSSTEDYKSVAGALKDAEDGDTLVLLANCDDDIKLPTGVSFDTDEYDYSGDVTAADGNGYEVVQNGTVYAIVDNTASTWTGSVDSLWGTAGNWSTGRVPGQYTTVTFNNAADIGIGEGDDVRMVAGLVLNGNVSLHHNTKNYSYWPSIKICGGNVTGTGTLTLLRCGFVGDGSATINVACPVVFAGDSATTHDCFLQNGPIVFNGTVSSTLGRLHLQTPVTFNGAVNLANATITSAITSGQEPTFNGAVTLGAGASIYTYAVTYNDALVIGEGAVVSVGSSYQTYGENFTMTGSGRFIGDTQLPSGKAKTALTQSTWTGTCEFKNMTIKSIWRFTDYGNENSKICFNNVTTYLATGSHMIGGIEIAAGGFKINGTYSSGNWTLPKLSGTGTFTVGTAGNNNKNVYFPADGSEFSGNIAFADDTANTRLVFGTTDREFKEKTICVGSDAVVGAGATWTASDEIYLDGIVKASANTSLSTVVGSGKIVYGAKPTGTHAFGEGWNGIGAIDYKGDSRIDLADYVNTIAEKCSCGTVEVVDGCTIPGKSYFGADVTPTLKVTGFVSISDGSSAAASKRTVSRITGDGVLAFGTADGVSLATVNYAVDNLVGWNGVITNAATATLVTNIVSGTGKVVYTAETPQVFVGDDFDGVVEFATAPSYGPSISNESECEVVIGYNWPANGNLRWYGGNKSTITVKQFTGDNTYLPDDCDLVSKLHVAGTFSVNNGNPIMLGSSGWAHARVIKMPALKVDGAFSLAKTAGATWSDGAKGCYWTESLDATGEGTISVGNMFALRIDAVDFPEAPNGTDVLVALALSGEGVNKGAIYGPSGVAGEQIPVTVNGAATEQTLVYDAAKGGLVLYVASSEIDPSVPTELDVSPEATKEQAEEAAAAMDVTKTADASSVDQATWNGYFTKTVEKVNDKWVATAALNPEAVLPVDDTVEDAKLTDMLKSVTAAALDDKTPTAVPTKAGLYYWIAGATEVGATTYTPGTAALGDGTKKALTMPTLDDEDGKAFYKVCVGVEAPVAE